jgi:signal transduction histidine kinase/ActR/RegA family two-component response regulator
VLLLEQTQIHDTAQARLSTLGARLLGAGTILLVSVLVLPATAAPSLVGWLLLVLATQAVDHHSNRALAAKKPADITRRDRLRFLAVTFVSVAVYVSIALLIAGEGGAVGSAVAMMFIGAGLLHVSLVNQHHRPYALTSTAPYVACALWLALTFTTGNVTHQAIDAIALIITFAGFGVHLIKANRLHATTTAELRGALAQAEALRAMSEQRQREAEAANAAKSRFLATMSHELRTPLNAIIGYSEIMLEGAEDDGRDTDAADHRRVLGASRRLLHQINGLLDLSKIEADQLALDPQPFMVPEFVADIVSTAAPLMDANGNRLVVTGAELMGAANTDAFRLGQCLLNLLSNAAKFTRNGEVSLECSRDGDRLQFVVRDTGIGIPAERIASLFEPFVQADAATSRNFGGTGLGLTITRQMISQMGGSVSVSSTPGQGSTFTLRLPALLAGKVAPPTDRRNGGRTALIVEDDPHACDLIARALVRVGFDTLHAASVAEAQARAAETRPSVIILDLNLPDASGIDALSRIKAAPGLANVAVIVVSLDDDKARSMAHGACAHLVKPVDRAELSAAALRFAATPKPEVEMTTPVVAPVRMLGAR